MGGVPTKHHSKSKVGRRRSQLAMKKVNVIPCPQCGGPALPHKICPQCGTYVKVVSKPHASTQEQAPAPKAEQ